MIKIFASVKVRKKDFYSKMETTMYLFIQLKQFIYVRYDKNIFVLNLNKYNFFKINIVHLICLLYELYMSIKIA